MEGSSHKRWRALTCGASIRSPAGNRTWAVLVGDRARGCTTSRPTEHSSGYQRLFFLPDLSIPWASPSDKVTKARGVVKAHMLTKLLLLVYVIHIVCLCRRNSNLISGTFHESWTAWVVTSAGCGGNYRWVYNVYIKDQQLTTEFCCCCCCYQIQGLGTALKILFSGREFDYAIPSDFHLKRTEIVSLFNAFGR